MTLPFKCADCGHQITLTTDEAIAIYEHRINLCQCCIDSMNEETWAEVNCAWDPERRAFVMVAVP